MAKRRCRPSLTRCPLRGRNCCRPRNAGHKSSSDTLHDEEPVVRSSTYFYKLRTTRRREGRYLLRTNLTENDPAQLWQYYTQLVAVEEAFRNLKGDLAIRPVFHQDEKRIEAHIFITFLAYCMQITLTRRLHALAPGL